MAKQENRHKKILRKKHRNTPIEWLCIILLCAPALIHVLIFWFGVQVETIKLAFTDYWTQEIGWTNFKWAWEQLFCGTSTMAMPIAFRNTMYFFLLGMALIPVTMFFAYLIFRKSIGYGFSRVTL